MRLIPARPARRQDRRHTAHVHLDEATLGALTDFGERRNLSATASIRLLVEQGLAQDIQAPSTGGEASSLRQQLNALGTSVLACLIAAEQNQRLLISLLPEGAERAEELWEEAATSARERLIRLDGALAEEAR